MSTNKYFITTRKIPTYIKYLIAKRSGGDTEEYQQLEYIESTGTQYIDTLINGEANWIAKFQGVSKTSTRSACLVTNEDGVEAGKGKWLGYNSSGKWGTSGNNFTTINYNEQVDINAEFKKAGITVTINGVELEHSTKLIFTNETWKLLSGSTSCPSSVRCYKASCYKENVLVGNFIPALRKSDSKPRNVRHSNRDVLCKSRNRRI